MIAPTQSTALLSLLLAAGIVLTAAGLAADPPAATAPDADRAAILAMAGEFEVTFDFEESVSLRPGYECKKPYQEDATELVIVVEDTPGRIALQHILSVSEGARVVKHWKQVWTREDTRIVEFQGRGQWKVRTLSQEEAAGTWSQLVTQVDDSPRYESYGKWRHDGGFSRWESGSTARPLPRREHTTRDDYEILLAFNRHALTPDGWVHEQDNLKQVLDESGAVSGYIARELGLNRYRRTESADFSKAREYWESTRAFWGTVSAYWEDIESGREEFFISEKVGDKSLDDTVNDIAKAIIKSGQASPGEEEVTEMLSPFVK